MKTFSNPSRRRFVGVNQPDSIIERELRGLSASSEIRRKCDSMA